MEFYSPEKGFKIAYEISGIEGKPKMVLIHGLYLNNGCWRNQLSAFENDFHILRYDLRGHGNTTKPKEQFIIQNYIDDLHALLEYLDWNEELYLVGHSLGGMIAMKYALEHPTHVSKMVISSSFCMVTQEAVAEVIGRINSKTLEKFAIEISVRGLSPYDDNIANYIAKLVTDHMTKDDCLRATNASEGFNICENLKSLEIPILLLVGEKDITTPVWASKMLHGWLPQSELKVIPEAGHLVTFSHPNEFNNYVIDFWNR